MNKLSKFASKNIPFLFLFDFEGKNSFVEKIENLENIYFQIDKIKNFSPKQTITSPKILKKEPVSLNRYKKAFYKIQKEIKKGNTYLINLTFPTKIVLNCIN